MEANKEMQGDQYKNFLIMLGISFVIMYAVMFLNVDEAGHIYLSLTRFYIALLMVSPMALLMLILMNKMYRNKKLNIVISLTAITAFVIALFFLRTQTLVKDIQYMKAMIPHHSSAILTSKQAKIEDPKVKKLSEEIIESQEREIEEMKQILKRMEK
ncbi:MAG: DUF305 domain-containing protein [Bacteroidia bacterium]